MRHSMFAALALTMLATLALSPRDARAGGAHVRVHAAATPGGPLRLELVECGDRGAYAVRAQADAMVGGERRTVALRAVSASERGWVHVAPPAAMAGGWVLRVRPSRGPAPTTVVAVSADGKPGESQLVWDGDGRKEAARLLAGR